LLLVHYTGRRAAYRELQEKGFPVIELAPQTEAGLFTLRAMGRKLPPDDRTALEKVLAQKPSGQAGSP